MNYMLQLFIWYFNNINNQGSSAESGHYVTYARDLEEDINLWYYFDDSMG